MPLMFKAFNTTLEKQEVMIDSRMYTFPPRETCDIREDHAPIMEGEHADKGIVILRGGDNFKEKEREGLVRYLRRLDERITNYTAWMDMMKSQGKTVDRPVEMTRAMRWREEITKKLNLERPLVEELSFNDVDEVAVEPVAQVEEVVVPKKRGRPAKTFTELEA